MRVKLMGSTRLTKAFKDELDAEIRETKKEFNCTDGQAIALVAIRTCYSALRPTDILVDEGFKYFGNKATDGKGGTEADRLFRHIASSGHTSTLEHISFTFALEGVSRSFLAQLTRHRIGFSFSAQSQRYVRFGSGDRSGGFDFTTPPSIAVLGEADRTYNEFMRYAQETYDTLRDLKVPSEDARYVLPNAANCNITVTTNLTAMLGLYSKRQKGRGAQWEIADVVEDMMKSVVGVEPWTAEYFESV